VNKRKIAVLASGGLDSNILIAKLLKKYNAVYPIYIRCGLNWEQAELYWLRKYLKKLDSKNLRSLTVLSLPVDDLDGKEWAVTGRRVPGYRSRDEEVYLPGRNLLLLAKAATFCALHKIPTLALGTLAANPFPDASKKFFKMMNRTSGEALRYPVKIIVHFMRLKKKDVLKKGEGLPLELSFSCLAPRGLKPCGRCNKCAEKDRLDEEEKLGVQRNPLDGAGKNRFFEQGNRFRIREKGGDILFRLLEIDLFKFFQE
jgi:7-cyano-7-deazaguanine synthase